MVDYWTGPFSSLKSTLVNLHSLPYLNTGRYSELGSAHAVHMDTTKLGHTCVSTQEEGPLSIKGFYHKFTNLLVLDAE